MLVVEDDDDLRRIFRDSLRFAGYDVTEAGDGTDALRMIESSPPDLIVLDIKLPTLDGIAVRDEIAAHANTRHILVVMVTGEDIPVQHLKAARVLRKPIAPETLVAVVRNCFAAAAV